MSRLKIALLVAAMALLTAVYGTEAAEPEYVSDRLRSPAVVAAGIDGSIYVADCTDMSVTKLDGETGDVIIAARFDRPPRALAVDIGGKYVYCAAGGADGLIYELDAATLSPVRTFPAGHTPSALALDPAGKRLFAANRFDGNVQVYSLSDGTLEHIISSPREPSALAVAGGTLFIGGGLPGGAAAGAGRDGAFACEITAVDLESYVSVTIKLPDGSTGLKCLAVSPDGDYVYASHVLSRYSAPMSQLAHGWICTNAISEIGVNKLELSATMLLDDIDLGAANPWGLAFGEGKLVAAIAGTGEVMLIDYAGMREKINGVNAGKIKIRGLLESAADIQNDLAFLTEFKTRLKLGADGTRSVAVSCGRIYAANYFSGSISVLDIASQSRLFDITLDTSAKADAVRNGEMLWNDASLTFQNWLSCASCHPDARTDGISWDSLTDGAGTPKQTRSVLNAFDRGSMLITGLSPGAGTAIRSSYKGIMLNGGMSEEQLAAVDEYVRSLTPEASPYLVNGTLNESAERGKTLFNGKAGCVECHSGATFSSSVPTYGFTQTGNEKRGLLAPTLIEVWRTAPYFYDGRAATVYDALTSMNPKDADGRGKLGNTDGLTAAELLDLIEYILSL